MCILEYWLIGLSKLMVATTEAKHTPLFKNSYVKVTEKRGKQEQVVWIQLPGITEKWPLSSAILGWFELSHISQWQRSLSSLELTRVAAFPADTNRKIKFQNGCWAYGVMSFPGETRITSHLSRNFWNLYGVCVYVCVRTCVCLGERL